MGSLSPSGLRIAQSDMRLKHKGRLINLTSVTGVPQDQDIANTSFSLNRAIFTADGLVGGNLEHDVTRKISGIHTSVSHREAIVNANKTGAQAASGVLSGDALGPMETVTERKIFFLDSDRNKSSGLSDWTIFNALGDALGATDGTTDTDITPN